MDQDEEAHEAAAYELFCRAANGQIGFIGLHPGCLVLSFADIEA